MNNDNELELVENKFDFNCVLGNIVKIGRLRLLRMIF